MRQSKPIRINQSTSKHLNRARSGASSHFCSITGCHLSMTFYLDQPSSVFILDLALGAAVLSGNQEVYEHHHRVVLDYA